MQASARIARFVAGELGLPLLDSVGSIKAHFRPPPGREVVLYFVNGPIAFSGIRDILGEVVLPRTRKIYWLQNDYTIIPPPHQSYSRPTKATTAFRREFFHVPEIAILSTCSDLKRDCEVIPVNWNALTYAPFIERPSRRLDSVFYYGALREDRKPAMVQYLDHHRVDISMSRRTKDVEAEWASLAPRAQLLPPAISGTTPVAANGNVYGAQPLLRIIATYRHSIYLADAHSASGAHSLANRFYEVLSTPDTVLWLEAEGAECYERFGLRGWPTFAIKQARDWDRVLRLSRTECEALARIQRDAWLQQDPFHQLQGQLRLL